jgi:hypothetical protein
MLEEGGGRQRDHARHGQSGTVASGERFGRGCVVGLYWRAAAQLIGRSPHGAVRLCKAGHARGRGEQALAPRRDRLASATGSQGSEGIIRRAVETIGRSPS